MKSKLVLAAAAFGCAACFAQAIRANGAIVVDGKLDEPAWKAAPKHGDFVRPASYADRKVTDQTEFSVVVDDRAVYFGILCHERDMAALQAAPVSSLWTSDDVEVYLAPTCSSFDFYQFAVGFRSEQRFAMFYSEGGNIRPDPFGTDWQAATFAGKDFWSCEIAIPLSAFYMTRNSSWKTQWLVNVSRSNHRTREHTCWSRVKRSFADSKNWNKLDGFPKRAAEFDVAMTDVRADFTRRDGADVVGEMKLKCRVAEGGEYSLESSACAAPQNLTLKAGDNEVALPCAVPGNGRHQVRLALTKKGGAKCVRTVPVSADFQALRVHLTSPEYRDNFYPGQDSSRVAGSVASALAGQVSVTLEVPGAAAQKRTLPAGGGAFEFKTPSFAPGTDAALVVEAGGETKRVKVRNLKPTGHRMAWISGGNLVVDGKPVLRRNMYAEYYMGGKAMKEKYDADDLHQTKQITSGGSFEPDRVIRGLEQREAVKDVVPCAEYFAKIDEMIEKKRNDDFAFWYICDEPECRNVSPIYLRHIYEHVKEKDPYHPLLTATRGGTKFIDCADWFETHPYLNPQNEDDGSRRYDRPFDEIGPYVEAFASLNRPDKCIGFLPTCFAYRGQTLKSDYPTFREYVTHTWAAMMRGGKSLYPYAYHDLGDRASIYEGTRYVFSSFEALEPIVLFGKRTTLYRGKDGEAVVYELPKEKMFVAANFTGAQKTMTFEKLRGDFREFRGKREWSSGFFGMKKITVVLAPFETVVATTAPHDAGLPTTAETAAKIDALERERVSRDNQLLERYADFEIAASRPVRSYYKMVDGVRDVIAWYDVWGKDKFYEIDFPKGAAAFRAVRVFGNNLGGMRVKIRKFGEWKELAPASSNLAPHMVEYSFAETHSTVKLRFEFPKHDVELYEIELPKCAAAKSSGAKSSTTNSQLSYSSEDVSWLADAKNAESQEGYTTKKWYGKGIDVRPNEFGGFTLRTHATKFAHLDPEHPWIVADLLEPKQMDPRKYHAWGIRAGHLGGVIGGVTHPPAGLYVARLPKVDKPQLQHMSFYDYDFELPFRYVKIVKEPANWAELAPADGADEIVPGGKVTVRVKLAAPCEDLSCSLFRECPSGVTSFSLNGTNAIELKATDGKGREWSATIDVARCEAAKAREVYLKVTTLGGALSVPMWCPVIVPFRAKP